MPKITTTHQDFIRDRQHRTFADVLDAPEQSSEAVRDFFNDANQHRRMLAGVVREIRSQRSQRSADGFLSFQHPRRTKRLRQAVGVVVRMVTEHLGSKKTGNKESLGFRATAAPRSRS